MRPEAFNAFCTGLPAARHVVQWGNSDVWKVGGKVFAVGGWGDGGHAAYAFKVTPIAYEILRDRPGLRPAPYLASRGMKWIQHYGEPGLNDSELKHFITASHKLVSLVLAKKVQRQLSLTQD